MVRTQSQFTISSDVDLAALASALEQLGWQVTDELSLPQAVEA